MSKTTRLINVGIVPTVPNKTIRVGDRMVYNYGHVYRVVGVKKESPQSRVLLVKDEETGKVYEKRLMNKGRWPVVDENRKFVRRD